MRAPASFAAAPLARPARRARRAAATRCCSAPAPTPAPVAAGATVAALGVLCVDLVAGVAHFPGADAKVRSTSFAEVGGGNAANAAVAARRLGAHALLVSVVGDDARGRSAVAGVRAAGVDAAHVGIARGARTPFSYVIVDAAAGTRAVIHTADPRCALPALAPPAVAAAAAADVLVLDGRHPRAAAQAARAAAAAGAFVLVDVERERDGAYELLALAAGAVVKDAFASAAAGIPPGEAAPGEPHLVALLARGPRWVIATRGQDGCVLVRRAGGGPAARGVEEIAGVRMRVERAAGGDVEAIYCDALPDVKVVDATGGGDGFLGAIAYAVATKMPMRHALVLASVVGARCVMGEGARASPHREELQSVFEELGFAASAEA